MVDHTVLLWTTCIKIKQQLEHINDLRKVFISIKVKIGEHGQHVDLTLVGPAQVQLAQLSEYIPSCD